MSSFAGLSLFVQDQGFVRDQPGQVREVRIPLGTVTYVQTSGRGLPHLKTTIRIQTDTDWVNLSNLVTTTGTLVVDNYGTFTAKLLPISSPERLPGGPSEVGAEFIVYQILSFVG
jgi:hypothetical protein